MFVLTADQVGSRDSADLVAALLPHLAERFGAQLALPPDRNAGDEVQALTADAATALEMALLLTRTGHWSVGVGVGEVREPLPGSVREATGPAFVAAREAVDQAKRASHRFALASSGAGLLSAAEVGALMELVLAVRARRSEEGWEVVDLLESGGTQSAAAQQLGITPQAVSLRVAAAQWRAEAAAVPALVVLLDDLDRGGRGGSTAGVPS